MSLVDSHTYIYIMDTNNTDSLLPYVRLRAMEPEDLEMLYDL